jgi:hypothetical protein
MILRNAATAYFVRGGGLLRGAGFFVAMAR